MNHELQPLDSTLSRENRLAQAQERFTEYVEAAEADPENHVLRPKQIELMRQLNDAFWEDGWGLSGYNALPTGIGKTFLFSFFLKVTGLRGLVVAPTLSITDNNTEIIKYSGIAEESISKLYGSSPQRESRHITLTTYGSLRKQSSELHPDNFDVLVLDEVHCALGRATRAVIENYSDCIKLGFTATDEYPDQKVEDMLPREISRMTLQEAVEAKLLVPLRNIVVMTDADMSNVRAVGSATDYRLDDLAKVIDVGRYNRQVVEFYIANFLGHKALASCATLRHAYNLAHMFREHGVLSEAIDGVMGRKKQLEIEERCRITDPASPDRIDVLTNAKLAEVGFDNPLISVGLNAVPTRSLVKHAQRVRVTRIDMFNPRKVGHVVDFVGRGLRWPPSLYAHPKIAGAAALGLNYDVLPQLKSVEGLKVISDPYEVDSLVAKYAEQEERVFNRPPDDWIVLSGLSQRIKNIPKKSVNAILDEIKRSKPDFFDENSAEFTVSGLVSDSRRATYFSFDMLEEIKSRMQRPEASPEGWLTAAQTGARYGFEQSQMSKILLRLTKELGDKNNAGKYSVGPQTTKVQNYYSPQCVKAMAESQGLRYCGNGVPKGWRSLEQLSVECGPNATKEALEAFARMQKKTLGISIVDHQMVKHSTNFYSAKVAELIRKRVEPSPGWLSWDDLIRQDGINPNIIGWLTEELKRYNIGGKLCMVNGQEVRYFPARLRTMIKQIADRP